MTRRRSSPHPLVLEVAVLQERVRGLEALVSALRERAEAAEARAQAAAEAPRQSAPGFAALAPSKLAELAALAEADAEEAQPPPAPVLPAQQIRWLLPPTHIREGKEFPPPAPEPVPHETLLSKNEA
jgi:hypothetical protein